MGKEEEEQEENHNQNNNHESKSPSNSPSEVAEITEPTKDQEEQQQQEYSWPVIRFDVPPHRTYHFYNQFRNSPNPNNFLKAIKWYFCFFFVLFFFFFFFFLCSSHVVFTLSQALTFNFFLVFVFVSLVTF